MHTTPSVSVRVMKHGALFGHRFQQFCLCAGCWLDASLFLKRPDLPVCDASHFILLHVLPSPTAVETSLLEEIKNIIAGRPELRRLNLLDPHLGRGLGQLIASRVPTETGRPPDTVAAARGCWSVGVLIWGVKKGRAVQPRILHLPRSLLLLLPLRHHSNTPTPRGPGGLQSPLEGGPRGRFWRACPAYPRDLRDTRVR